MQNAKRHGLRILVSASSFSDAAAALRIVEHLSHDVCEALGGVLVEEPEMLAACQFAGKRIVGISGTTAPAPTRSQVRMLLKADARAFQQSLARTAFPFGTQSVFTQDAGDLLSTALRAAAGWDVLVIGYRQLHHVRGKIVHLVTSAASMEEMNEISNRLSQQLDADRTFFSVGTTSSLESAPLPQGSIQFGTLDDALRVLMRTNAAAVLVDLKHGPVQNQSDLARLLDAARCPLIVFGASNTPALLEHSTQIPPP